MLPRTRVEHPPARGPRDQPGLEQIGFDHILDRVARFAEHRRERLHPHRAAAIDVADTGEISPFHRIEPARIQLEPVGPTTCGLRVAYRAYGHSCANHHAPQHTPRPTDRQSKRPVSPETV